VTPNARSDEIRGWRDEELQVKVAAPAADGRANQALCAFLAGRLGLPRRSVVLHRGAVSRHKLLDIVGVDLASVRSRLGGADAEL